MKTPLALALSVLAVPALLCLSISPARAEDGGTSSGGATTVRADAGADAGAANPEEAEEDGGCAVTRGAPTSGQGGLALAATGLAVLLVGLGRTRRTPRR